MGGFDDGGGFGLMIMTGGVCVWIVWAVLGLVMHDKFVGMRLTRIDPYPLREIPFDISLSIAKPILFRYSSACGEADG